MQMVTLFKQILINVLGSKQTAGAVRDIKDEIPLLGILITHERRTCDGIVHNMDPIGNDTFMTETLYNESGKIIITNTSKEDGPMGQFCHLSSKNCWRGLRDKNSASNSPIAQIVIVTKPLSFLKPFAIGPGKALITGIKDNEISRLQLLLILFVNAAADDHIFCLMQMPAAVDGAGSAATITVLFWA